MANSKMNLQNSKPANEGAELDVAALARGSLLVKTAEAKDTMKVQVTPQNAEECFNVMGVVLAVTSQASIAVWRNYLCVVVYFLKL